jgi:transposase InsO family protein
LDPVAAESVIIAENLLLKQQLIIHNRSRQRAPNLSVQDRPDPGNHGPSWLTIIGHAKDSLWSVDLFRCESILLKSHWVMVVMVVMVVMDQYTRRIIGFAVHAGSVDGPALCRMFNQAASGQGWPKYLSSDNDPLFQYHRWSA